MTKQVNYDLLFLFWVIWNGAENTDHKLNDIPTL